MIRYLFFPLFISLLISCTSSRQIQTGNVKTDTALVGMTGEDSIAFIKNAYDSIQKNKIDFNFFSAKINVNYKDAEDKEYNLNTFLRMKKDSLIWVSVNAVFGIEAMRLLISKDSVKILDKQNKVYTARSISYLQEVSGLPLELQTMQDLLMGNVIFLEPGITAFNKAGSELSLLSIGYFFRNLAIFHATDYNILRSRLDNVDPQSNRSADLFYNNYVNKSGVKFSETRKIIINDTKKLLLDMEFKQFDFNEELTFPFSIPANYGAN